MKHVLSLLAVILLGAGFVSADSQAYAENTEGKLTGNLTATQDFSLDLTDTSYYEAGFSRTPLSDTPDPTTTSIEMAYDSDSKGAEGTFHVYWLCASSSGFSLNLQATAPFSSSGKYLGYSIYEEGSESPVIVFDADGGAPVSHEVVEVKSSTSFQMTSDSKEYRIVSDPVIGSSGIYKTTISLTMESI